MRPSSFRSDANVEEPFVTNRNLSRLSQQRKTTGDQRVGAVHPLVKGGIMKTFAILALLALGLVTTAGCHWGHHGHHRYSDSYYRR